MEEVFDYLVGDSKLGNNFKNFEETYRKIIRAIKEKFDEKAAKAKDEAEAVKAEAEEAARKKAEEEARKKAEEEAAAAAKEKAVKEKAVKDKAVKEKAEAEEAARKKAEEEAAAAAKVVVPGSEKSGIKKTGKYENSKKKEERQRTLWIFNDNIEQHNTNDKGERNEAIRVFNQYGEYIDHPYSAGISTGSFH